MRVKLGKFPRIFLRTFILVIAIVGCGLGWAVSGARKQHEAVVAIGRSGGFCEYSIEDQNRSKSRSWIIKKCADYICNHIGIDYISYVNRAGVGANDSDLVMSYVKNLNRLETLDLAGSSVTDRGMKHTSVMTTLKYLSLAHTSISDTALESVGRLYRLEQLDLESTGITDKGLAKLSGLAQIEDLGIRGTKISDSGIGTLVRLKSLKTLDVSGSKITSVGVGHIIGNLHRLQALSVTVDQLSKNAIDSIMQSRSIERIIIDSDDDVKEGTPLPDYIMKIIEQDKRFELAF